MHFGHGDECARAAGQPAAERLRAEGQLSLRLRLHLRLNLSLLLLLLLLLLLILTLSLVLTLTPILTLQEPQRRCDAAV